MCCVQSDADVRTDRVLNAKGKSCSRPCSHTGLTRSDGFVREQAKDEHGLRHAPPDGHTAVQRASIYPALAGRRKYAARVAGAGIGNAAVFHLCCGRRRHLSYVPASRLLLAGVRRGARQLVEASGDVVEFTKDMVTQLLVVFGFLLRVSDLLGTEQCTSHSSQSATTWTSTTAPSSSD